MEHRIINVPLVFVPAALRKTGHLLLRGLSVATDKLLSECVDDIIEGRTEYWLVSDGAEFVGAFLTAIVDIEDGKTALDVFGLGGRDLRLWGKALSQEMAEHASRNGCSRIVFCGAKALSRIYEDVHIVGEHSPGVFKYERAVS